MYDELNWNEFIQLQEKKEYPKISIPFSLNTPYLQKDFSLDLLIWNLSDENLEITKKVVFYVLSNFNKLFETAWTAIYYRLLLMDWSPMDGHTLSEFYQEKINFESPYYTIQLEINSEHLIDGTARYCFVVSTSDDVSEDNLRCYMVNNQCWATDTNNDDMQMLMGFEFREKLYQNPVSKEFFMKAYEKMSEENFKYAESFH